VKYGGRLPDAVVNRIVRQKRPDYLKCFAEAAATAPKVAGRLVLRFVIERSGAVTRVSSSSTPPSLAKAVGSCVELVFSGLEFPQPEGGIHTVSFPIDYPGKNNTPKAP